MALTFIDGELRPIEFSGGTDYVNEMMVFANGSDTVTNLIVSSSPLQPTISMNWFINWVNLIDNYNQEDDTLRGRMLFAKKQKEMLVKMKKYNRRKYLKQVKSYLKSSQV